VNGVDDNGSTAVMWAAYAGNAPHLQHLLLEHKADYRHVNKFGSTAMHYAIYKGMTHTHISCAALHMARESHVILSLLCYMSLTNIAWCSCDARNAVHMHWNNNVKLPQRKTEVRQQWDSIEHKLTREHAAANKIPHGILHNCHTSNLVAVAAAVVLVVAGHCLPCYSHSPSSSHSIHP
jgi:hypothetical protein